MPPTDNASSKPVCLIWLREDLRLADNPALHHATHSGKPVIAMFVNETPCADAPFGNSPYATRGAASRWWHYQNLKSFKTSLARMGIPLLLRTGKAIDILPQIATELGADEIIWSRRYGPTQIFIDKKVKECLTQSGHQVKTFNARLLVEPWEITTKTGAPFRVFTPFWKALKLKGGIRRALAIPAYRQPLPRTLPYTEDIDDWKWCPQNPDWAQRFHSIWQAGEGGAAERLNRFITKSAPYYKTNRNIPGEEGTSGLSPHLQGGTVSAVSIWHRIQSEVVKGTIPESAADVFLSELAWREFSYTLLYYNPHMLEEELQPKFQHFPWEHNASARLQAWQLGQTGYPIVDAGMRQLWQTGYMHNRVRMIVGSFLVKHLLIDWRAGMSWFWDTLLDADIASNTASWQWIAGCGADAAPYFRIFNPMTQGARFDPEGHYVRKYIPELAELPAKVIHRPWEASSDTLKRADVCLGKTYPKPLVDHTAARKAALDAYHIVKSRSIS